MSAVLNSRPATGSCKEVPPVKQIQEGIQKDRVWIHVAYCGICMYHSARKCDVADKFERFNLHGIEKLLKNEKGFEGEPMVNLYKKFPANSRHLFAHLARCGHLMSQVAI